MKCCVSSCKSYSDKRSDAMNGVTFHVFPSDDSRKQQWITRLNRKNWTPSKYTKICSWHFKEDDFTNTKKFRKTLKKEAVPSLNLELMVTDSQTASKSTKVPNTQQIEEDPEMNETIPDQIEEIPEGKIIIARVYHYFKNEYDIFKAFTGNHWVVNPLANYLQRTAEATGVNEQTITVIVESKEYSLEKEQVANQGNCDARVTESRGNGERMVLENECDRLKPDTLVATSSSVGTEPSDKKELPFPAPIQLSVHGVLGTEFKIEPAENEPLTIDDDPLKSEDSVDQEYFDIPITEMKIEPEDTDMLTLEQSINSIICDSLQTNVVPVHVKAEPSSPAD